MKKLLLSILMVPLLAFAWAPEKGKTVTVIVGNQPGAGNEVSFRKLAEIVEKNNPNFSYAMMHIPGQDSAIANNRFLDIVPDGYTLNLPSHMSSYVTNEIWQAKIKKYQWDSFTDILTMGKSPLVLVANTKSTVETPIDFVRYLAKSTKPINIATGGGAHRVAYEYLITKAHGDRDLIKPIKFNGPLPAVVSVGQWDGKTGTEFGIMPITIAQPLIQAGKIKPIGFTGTWVPHQYPTVPLLNTVAPGINVYAAWSMELPPNAPANIVAWYQREFSKAVRSKEYAQWREQNVVFYEESELAPAGLKRQMVHLRETFLPVLRNIDLSKE
jgi:tripartite-type tricarboxylate transporter receptor subunit TctC